MERKRFSLVRRALLVAVFLLTLLPVSVFAQRRWVVVRPRRSQVVVYQPGPYVSYQRPYYASQYYSYQQPYYSTRYYSYGYSQPYYVNRYAYSSAYPTYGYGYNEYRPRYGRSRVRVGIWLR
ncbi:MAG TPA: hypothetical protein VF397_04845 [Pyrinomonadaceae bacterium]